MTPPTDKIVVEWDNKYPIKIKVDGIEKNLNQADLGKDLKVDDQMINVLFV